MKEVNVLKERMNTYAKRKQIRLQNYDYSNDNFYFVTICTYEKQEIFWSDCRGAIPCALNKYGNIVKHYWEMIPEYHPHVILDEYVIMPNHVHGIIYINTNTNGNHIDRGNRAQGIAPLRNEFGRIIPGSLGSIIRGFKTGVTKWFRNNTNLTNIWQRNYHDHIIRNDTSLRNIREYIINNSATWDNDKNNPAYIQ